MARGTPRRDSTVVTRRIGTLAPQLSLARIDFSTTAVRTSSTLRATPAGRGATSSRDSPPARASSLVWATKVPRPLMRTIWRSSSRMASAWRTTTRLTPKPRASSGSDGIASPGCHRPDSIRSLSTSWSW